jgi:hypothetical protein
LDGRYDHFCTTGIPLFTEEQVNHRRWILNGWTKNEALQAMITLQVHQDNPLPEGAMRNIVEKANQAYWLCGGTIRNLLFAYADYKKVENRIGRGLDHIDTIRLKAAYSEIMLTDDFHPVCLEWLQIMFRNKKEGSDDVMRSLLFVDSQFKLKYIENRVDAVQGRIFKNAVHVWFVTVGTTIQDPSTVVKVCWSVGTKRDCVKMLKERNMYWMPCVSSDSENIDYTDGAIVVGDNLHVFQMTVMEQHGFNLAIFIEKFALPVWETLRFKAVFIHILTPSDITFDYEGFTENFTGQFAWMETEPHEKDDKYYFDIDLQPLFQTLDMTSGDTYGTSMEQLLETLSMGRAVGQKHGKITDRVKRWFTVQKEETGGRKS